MYRILAIVAMGILGMGAALAQNAAPTGPGKSSVELSGGTTIDATLNKSIDVKKNKPGDRVEARAAQDVKQDGGVVLKKGTSLIGHVAQVQARGKDQSRSQLVIVFDQVVLKSGEEIPLHAVIVALAAPQAAPDSSAGFDEGLGSDSPAAGASSAASGIGGPLGGPTATSSAPTGINVNAAASGASSSGGPGAVGGLTPQGRLALNSSGVFGLDGLSIDLLASNATEGSMIFSPTKNVHLDGSTQMLLRIADTSQ